MKEEVRRLQALVRVTPIEFEPNTNNPERDQRARELLEHVVGTEAFNDFYAKGYVEVKSKLHPGQYIQIRPLGAGTLIWERKTQNGVAHERPVAMLCIQLVDHWSFPMEDQMVALYLLAKYDEQRFYRTANLVEKYV